GARMIAWAWTDMELGVREGRFRVDLFHRLRVLPVHVPALRDRKGDLPFLIRRLLDQLTESDGRRPPTLTAEAISALAAYEWPGNVRELKHVLQLALMAGAYKSI